MIKSLSLLTRKSTMSREEFRRIWVGEHAPLVLAVPQVRRYVLRSFSRSRRGRTFQLRR